MAIAVWFNEDQKEVFDYVRSSGAITQSFSDFVKQAFHDRLDNVLVTQKDTSEDIEPDT